ncbi:MULTISPECIES: hypothetical protein [unclassified Lysinibacillus]
MSQKQISDKSGSIFIVQYVGHAFRSTITGAVTLADDLYKKYPLR